VLAKLKVASVSNNGLARKEFRAAREIDRLPPSVTHRPTAGLEVTVALVLSGDDMVSDAETVGRIARLAIYQRL
jgi:hypothetical protein